MIPINSQPVNSFPFVWPVWRRLSFVYQPVTVHIVCKKPTVNIEIKDYEVEYD